MASEQDISAFKKTVDAYLGTEEGAAYRDGLDYIWFTNADVLFKRTYACDAVLDVAKFYENSIANETSDIKWYLTVYELFLFVVGTDVSRAIKDAGEEGELLIERLHTLLIDCVCFASVRQFAFYQGSGVVAAFRSIHPRKLSGVV